MQDGLRDADGEHEDEALEAAADVDSEKSSVISDDEDDIIEDSRWADLESRPWSGTPTRPGSPNAPRVVTYGMQGRTLTQTRVPQASKDATAVTWSDLPRKDQLIVLTLARLSEPLVQTSLQVSAVADPTPFASY